tara:strand:+ start:70 stop:1581 length:1512 start_codon:yes stop_codon:yes gene_type:complete
MAVSFVQYPNNLQIPIITNWTPMIGYMVFSNDNNTSFFYQKLILRVRLDSSTGDVIALLKQRGNSYAVDITNNNARAFFDLREIANAQTGDTYFDQNCDGAPFEPIHSLGANTSQTDAGADLTDFIFSFNGDRQRGLSQITKLYVQATQEYSTNISEAPTYLFSGSSPNDTRYYMQATLPLLTPRFLNVSTVNAEYIQGSAFTTYRLAGASSQFLSDIPQESFMLGGSTILARRNFVNYNTSTTIGDYHTLAFLNGNDFLSVALSIKVQYFQSDGSSLGIFYFNNESTTGGMAPASVSTNTQRLLYFGCGPGNLQGQTINTSARPSAMTGWAYYTVTAHSTASGVGGTALSVPYYFVKSESCSKYERRRLGFLNSVGGYDYMNFTLRNVQTVEIKRETYDKMLGFFQGSKYRYDDTDRGVTTKKVTAKLTETLQTDYITEEMVPFIETMLLSKRVDVIQTENDRYTVPVIIKDSSFVRKTTANDNLIQYTVKIEYAHPINTNT